LLGRLTLTVGDDATPVRLSTRKSGALLAYLAMAPEHTASREELATLLWGSCSDQQARQSLRQALAFLRKELPIADCFVADTNVVRLQPGAWSVDASEFDGLSKSTAASDLMRAAALFGGEFLSGLNIEEEGFDEWVNAQRQRVQAAASRLCEIYAIEPDLVIDGDAAIAVIEKLLTIDPLREDWHRLALIFYARSRGKNEALARAEAFATILKRELGVAPEKETRALIEKIRASETALERLPVEIAAPGLVNKPPPAVSPSAPAPSTTTEVLTPDIASQRRWMRFPMSGTIAVAPSLIGVLALGAVGLSYTQLSPAKLVEQATIAPGTDGLTGRLKSGAAPEGATDPWASPPLPSKATGETAAVANKSIIPILILPFKTFGESAGSTELLADMVTDDLTNLLSRVRSMRVISRQTALTFKGRPVDVAAVGAELQVRYVLDGSMRMQGEKLRVNVELIDPKTRLPVWSTRIERADADRNGTVDEIVGRLARELQLDISAIESAMRSNDADADALVHRGWAALKQINLQGYKQAESYFKQALERDPQNLSAELGLGAYHARIGVHILDNEPAAHRKKALEILEDVIRRDPQSGAAYSYLGLTLDRLSTLAQSVEAYEHAIEIDPSNASAHAHIGHALARTGRPAEGLVHIRYAMRLSPRDPIMPAWFEFVGNAELELNQLEQAAEDFRRATELNPGYPRAWAGLAAAHALAGRSDAARSDAAKLKTFAPTLDAQALVERFGRHKTARVTEGLELALALPEAAAVKLQTTGRATTRSESTQ
jgi:DNA-binding SARP family transcriptional activator/TolB-like protein/Tfp pilus assembly protein PilF